ncbi:hypothetical protein CAPTEDRAFT_191309 [Capitella teleta]|uniref:G-protein coupled receptors family 1 profile domain-containing protein n=1 Tax=Capitella teleta TaxID=283909 RepID=R7UDL7_CAPTE|nr:hypothetical protein CAPTEDRAFT_191309 [Capitella teleta]|eukprot:ELU01883.1 hypothetical protein CAPTEDRAFT_191309 [Capitella teleta]
MDSSTSEPQNVTDAAVFDETFGAVLKQAVYYSWYKGVFICVLVFAAAGITGNLLTILAYVKYEQLQSPTNLLICSQSIGDLLICLCGGPMFAAFNYTEAGQALASSNKYLCLVSLLVSLVALQSSITNILALSTERFIAVYFSLHYYNWVTDRNVKIVVVVIWAVIISINCLPLFGWNDWKSEVACMPVTVYPQLFVQSLFALPSLIFVLVSTVENFAMAVTAVRRQRSIAAAVVVPNADQQTEEAKIKSGNQFKVTKMLLLVVGCFFTAWLPWIILSSILYRVPSSWKMNGVPKGILIAFEYSKCVLGANSIANPFIYGWKNKMFRDAYYKLLGIRRTQDET